MKILYVMVQSRSEKGQAWLEMGGMANLLYSAHDGMDVRVYTYS